MADGIMSSFGQKYSENFDPTMVGLSLLSTANNQDRAQNLGQALLMGRQARLDEAQARAAAAAAKRSEAIKMAEKGMYETDKGFGRRQVKQDPTGGSYMVDMSPEGQVSTQQLFAPPAKAPEQKENYAPVQAVNAEGKPVVYMVNKYNPQDYYELGGAIQKGGKPGAGAGSGQGASGSTTDLQRYSTDLENFINYFPVMDKSGNPVAPEALVKGGFDPRTMKVQERAPLATGALSGLPSLTDTAQDVDALRKKINANEFIGNLLAAKASGATFGSLTEGEASKLETFRSVIADPKTPPQRIVQEYIALQRYIDNEIAPKYQSKQPQGPSLSPSAQRYLQ